MVQASEFRRFREAARRHWRLVLASGLAVSFLAFAVSYLKAEYEVTSRVLIRPIVPDPTMPTQPQVGVVSPAGLPVLELRGDTYATLVQSRDVIERIVEHLHQEPPADAAGLPRWRDTVRAMARKIQGTIAVVLHLRRPFAEFTPEEEELLEVKESVSGNLLPKSAVFRITAQHRNPRRAAQLARLAAETFVEYTQRFNASEATITRTFLEREVENARGALLAAQAKLDTFRRERGIVVSLDDEAKQRASDLITLESTVRTLEGDIRQSETRIRQTRSELGAHDERIRTALTTDVNPIVRDLRLQLVGLESRLPALLADFTPKHPQVIAMNQQIAEIKSQIQTEIRRMLTSEVTALNPVHQTLLGNLAVEEINLQGLTARKAAVDGLLSRLRDELSSVSQVKNTWDLLNEDVKFWTTRLDKTMVNLDGARLTETTKLAEIRVLEVGIPPRFPTWKGMPLLVFPAVGLVVGLATGGGLAAALHHLSRRARDPDSARQHLNLPLYGVVDGGSQAAASSLFPAADAVWNSYRYVRMKLLSTSVDGRPLRCLVLAGLTPDEDPAGVAARLGVVCAEVGHRTLVMDCRGSDGQGGGPSLGQPQLSNLHFPNLQFLPDGSAELPPPGDPLWGEKLAALLGSHRAAYDVVLLVAPSIQQSVEAARLASAPEVDALLLVVWHQRTDLEACQEAKSRMELTGVRHVGLLYAKSAP